MDLNYLARPHEGHTDNFRTYPGRFTIQFAIRVQPGQDVIRQILAINHPGARRIDVLNASGIVNAVSFRGHPDTGPELLTGDHTITGLAGSYQVGFGLVDIVGMTVTLMSLHGNIRAGNPLTLVAVGEVSVVLATTDLDFLLTGED